MLKGLGSLRGAEKKGRRKPYQEKKSKGRFNGELF